MKRFILFDRDDYNNNAYYYIPRKAKVQGVIKFYEKMGIEYTKIDVFCNKRAGIGGC